MRLENTYIIAEIGLNHNGDAQLAADMIKAAKEVGASAVKFQFYNTEDFLFKTIPGETGAQIENPAYDLLQSFELSEKDWHELKQVADKTGIDFFASVFDNSSVNLLQDLGSPIVKISSGDLTNYPMLKYAAIKFETIIMSTGMCYEDEIKDSVEFLKRNGAKDIKLLHCISNYPTKIEDANVRAIIKLKKLFDLDVGFSSHCEDNYASFAAVSLGAKIIEKHFTLDNNLPGPDQKLSLDKKNFKELVRGIRNIEKSLGKEQIRVLDSELEIRKHAFRSLCLNCDLKNGDRIEEKMIISKRPLIGIPAEEYKKIIGKKLDKAYKKGDLLDDLLITD